jgi:DNA polymerase-3 subunit gamma/tau
MAKRTAPAEATPPATPPAPNYTVLARRYRPQQFCDLVGQEAVAQALANAIASGRVAHAYLFTGVRGVGKTSAARILAKALNCVNGPTATPCDQCENCRAIATGEDIDVLEIDGASNNSVDDVRELRQNAQFRPSHSRYKIYIIDEVHMLAAGSLKNAFNALLKTLEEPPPHVKFIFATTEVQRIPATILSRCQRFDFGGISLPRIVERLREIVAAEGMQADDEALQTVARRAGGSMRDAQSVLDQLLAFSGERLTVETVHQLLGTANEERVASLAAAVLQKDARQALEVLGGLVNQGQQLGELLDQLIEYWRDLMVVRSAGADGQDLSVSGQYLAALKQQAEGLTLDTILAGLDVLVAAKGRLRFSSHARVVLEMALVRLAQLEDLMPVAHLVQMVTGGAASPPRASASAAQSIARTPIEKKKLTSEGDAAVATPSVSFREENLQGIWQQVIADAGFALASELRKIHSIAISGPNALVLRVPERYNNTASGVLDATRWVKVEPILSRVVGQSCSVRVEMVREEPAATPTAAPQTATAGTKQVRERVRQIPQVQKARDVLGAEIVSVDPDFGETAAPVSEESATEVPDED